ncbi:hypothetical protein [Siminovitchia terrae]|uniref:hypothetical protein n=1 Tax=Siminovitchia terrae TaxID=1914933 RepID=UPI001B10BAA9|nr:hypothetical protein [Siminovitchia terrae]GIN90245.1 hypothetical protein J22TS1_12960 [Siminovitchia terrae]
MLVKIKKRLPLIGALFLAIVALFNIFSDNEALKGFISISLFFVVLFLYFLTKNIKVED